MDGFFIQVNSSGGFNEPAYRPDLENYNIEELVANGWYPLVIKSPPAHDINRKRSATYTLQDGVVYQNYIVEMKEGEELTTAIRQKWNEIRFIRDDALKNCDWTQLSDAPLTIDKKVEWATYRQKLRDITTQVDPFNIVWPFNPNGLGGTLGVIRVG